MAPTRLDYDPAYVASARPILLELAHLLAPYRQGGAPLRVHILP